MEHKKESQVSCNRLKLRVVEIYYGYMDYIQCVTTGKTQRHSLSSRNAYAICKPEKIPFIPADELVFGHHGAL